jgi:Undecaprenyl-phosphate galactose phosphotransferase WbaP
LTADIIAILAATALGVAVWHEVNVSVSMTSYFDRSAVAALVVLVYYCFGLYTPFGINPAEELRRSVLAMAVVSLVLIAGAFFAKDAASYSRGALLLSSVLGSVLIPCARSVVRGRLASRDWWGVPVVVLGAGETAASLIENLHRQPDFGLKPVACLDDDPRKHGYCAGIPVVGPLSDAPTLAVSLGIRHAVVAMPGIERERLVSVLARYGAAFSNVIVIPNLFGIASLWVSTRDIGGVLGLEVRQNLLVPVNRWLKRAMDITLGGAFGLLAIPLVAVAGIWIKLASAGSMFYTQEREGETGTAIRVRKLRTMHRDADELLTRHLEDCPAAMGEWLQYCKLKNDPRIVPGVGHLLRRSSLDELPQLWSVLKGEMSLVGPRPFPRYHLDRFDPEFRSLRTRVKPGLTGLWQVSARNDGDLGVQKALDSYYIRNWSLWLDLHILARTAKAVLFAKGAY